MGPEGQTARRLHAPASGHVFSAMLRILFSLCLLVWLVVPAPAVRADPPADYFPLVPGTGWIYRTNIGQDLIMTVGGVAQVGGVTCRVLEGIINGMLTQRECYRRNGGTVYAYVRAYPQGNVVLTPPQPMLMLPPKGGHGGGWGGSGGERRVGRRPGWPSRGRGPNR